MGSNVLNHKSERGKSQNQKNQCINVCVCVCVQNRSRKSLPCFLQYSINFVRASSHYVEFLLSLELVLSAHVIPCNLENGFCFKSCLILWKIMNGLLFLLPVELIVLALKSSRRHPGENLSTSETHSSIPIAFTNVWFFPNMKTSCSYPVYIFYTKI